MFIIFLSFYRAENVWEQGSAKLTKQMFQNEDKLHIFFTKVMQSFKFI